MQQGTKKTMKLLMQRVIATLAISLLCIVFLADSSKAAGSETVLSNAELKLALEDSDNEISSVVLGGNLTSSEDIQIPDGKTAYVNGKPGILAVV